MNLQDQNHIAEIDPAKDTVVGSYPMGDCRGNHGMALDPEHRRAFLSCEDNDLMTVFDLDTHKVIASLPMASGADVIKFDAGLQRIYVACGSGAISIFRQDEPHSLPQAARPPGRKESSQYRDRPPNPQGLHSRGAGTRKAGRQDDRVRGGDDLRFEEIGSVIRRTMYCRLDRYHR